MALSRVHDTPQALHDLLGSLHDHMLLQLTSSIITHLNENPGQDLWDLGLMDDVDKSLRWVVHSSSYLPSYFLKSLRVVPLQAAVRRRLHAIISEAVVPTLLYAILFVDSAAIAWVQHRDTKFHLHPEGLLPPLLASFCPTNSPSLAYVPCCIHQISINSVWLCKDCPKPAAPLQIGSPYAFRASMTKGKCIPW